MCRHTEGSVHHDADATLLSAPRYWRVQGCRIRRLGASAGAIEPFARRKIDAILQPLRPQPARCAKWRTEHRHLRQGGVECAAS